MNRRVYVRLDQPRVEALVRLAEVERRHPSDQAAVLLAPIIDRLISQQTTPPKEVLTT